MAIMIPSVISPDIKSTAEKHIFKWFQNAPGTSDWIILHSLGISNHKKVIHGEVDFFALIPGMGIFALEVKGGRVRRENGIWSFTNKHGHADYSARGPFDQAWEGIFSLKESIKNLVDDDHKYLSNLLFGIGVMFPDIYYESVGVDEEPWQVFDNRDGNNVYNYVCRIAEGAECVWRDKRGELKEKNYPTTEDVRYLASLLRGDFDFVPFLGTQMQYADEQLIALTKEQYKCLDQLDENPRCLVRGTAGTGKTLLAIEAAKKAVANGEYVALFCYNRLLGNWLHENFKQQSLNLRPLYVGTLHGFMSNVVKSSGKDISLLAGNHSNNFYEIILPVLAKEILLTETVHFDRIIIDEAQDIITPEYLGFLDACVQGGLDRGKWMMFGDFSMQNIYGENRNEKDLVKCLEERATFVRFRLNINCRNTQKICNEIGTITGNFKNKIFQKIIDGPPVQYITYENQNDQRDKLVKILIELFDNQVEPGDITILSPRKMENSVVNLLQGIEVRLYEIPKIEMLTYYTIQGFKGLENKVIILVDIMNLRDKNLMYVALSRARTGLYVFETIEAYKEYTELFIKRRLK